jgi:hypothetical protein
MSRDLEMFFFWEVDKSIKSRKSKKSVGGFGCPVRCRNNLFSKFLAFRICSSLAYNIQALFVTVYQYIYFAPLLCCHGALCARQAAACSHTLEAQFVLLFDSVQYIIRPSGYWLALGEGMATGRKHLASLARGRGRGWAGGAGDRARRCCPRGARRSRACAAVAAG